ncbi:MAG TPA: HmuY family protein [Polyangiaceae bacterium]|nr:HmuY family protein [Polyangiaceae bacterium]
MRMKLLSLALCGVLAALVSCTSEPIDDAEPDTGTSGSSSTGGTDSVDPTPSACSAALRQSLSLVDEVSTATVSVLSESGEDRTLYIDASAGGLNGQDSNPWVYIEFLNGGAVAVTDLEALTSKAWDLAFKRSVVRTNSGDSGPGAGGAIRVALPWDDVDASTLGNKVLPTESWFDADCMLELDASQNLITTFSGWSEYDEAEHVLSAAPDVVFITAAANGLLYKVSVLDYYSTPTGAHGTVSGRYKVRTAPLL